MMQPPITPELARQELERRRQRLSAQHRFHKTASGTRYLGMTWRFNRRDA